MLVMGTERQRRNIIEKLIATFAVAREKGIEINESLLIKEICRTHGVTERKAKEYIKIAK